jgi:hypothetical protein
MKGKPTTGWSASANERKDDMKKLFTVEIEGSVMVASTSEEEAMRVVQDLIHATAGKLAEDLYAADAEEVSGSDSLPDGWDEKCLPYGATDSKAIGDYLQEGNDK